MGSRVKSSPKVIATAERRRYVMQLRESGATFQMIADACRRQFGVDNLPSGYDERQAHQDVMRALERINKDTAESAEGVVTLELLRLDRMLLAIWQRCTAGDLFAIDRAIKISDRRAKYTGTNAPKLIAPVTPDGAPLLSAAELVALLDQAERLMDHLEKDTQPSN